MTDFLVERLRKDKAKLTAAKDNFVSFTTVSGKFSLLMVAGHLYLLRTTLNQFVNEKGGTPGWHFFCFNLEIVLQIG